MNMSQNVFPTNPVFGQSYVPIQYLYKTLKPDEGLIKIGYDSAIMAIKPTQREFEFVETNLNRVVDNLKKKKID